METAAFAALVKTAVKFFHLAHKVDKLHFFYTHLSITPFLIAQQIADRHLSVRDVEKLIKKRKASGAALKKKNPGAETDPALELSYREIEERMKQSLGTKVSIRYGRDGKGKMEIDFYSHEDLERIVDLLG